MKPKTILTTLIVALVILAPVTYYTREKQPPAVCLHKFGKWSEEKPYASFWPMPFQFHYCSKCGFAERRKI